MAKHALNDYIALLEERGLLAAPVPEGLDRSAPVELVSYDSRRWSPIPCSSAREPTSRRSSWQWPGTGERLPM